MDVVQEILEKTSHRTDQYKSITVEKHLELEFDVGTLLALDKNDLDTNALKERKEEYLLNLSRDNTQLLFNKIWELPTERIDETVVAKLPGPTFVLPRAKPVPKAKPLTKWEQFAKEKGIDKKKKPKLKWDEQLQKWVPLFGYRRAVAEREKEWIVEIPKNADPMDDFFAKSSNAKTERVAKNELQRLRNIAKAKNVKVPRTGFTAVDKSSAKDLSAAITVAKTATASLGKFQNKLPKEKVARGIGAIVPDSFKKRKPPPVPSKVERSENIAIIDSIINKKPKLDINKAVARHLNAEQEQPEETHQSKRKSAANNNNNTKKRSKVAKGRVLKKKFAPGQGKKFQNKKNIKRK